MTRNDLNALTLDAPARTFLRDTYAETLRLPDARHMRDALRATYAENGLNNPTERQLLQAAAGAEPSYRAANAAARMYADEFDTLKRDTIFIVPAQTAANALECKPYAEAAPESQKAFHLATFSNLTQLVIMKGILTLTGAAPKLVGANEVLSLDPANPFQFGALHVIGRIKQATLLSVGRLWELPGAALEKPLAEAVRRDPPAPGMQRGFRPH